MQAEAWHAAMRRGEDVELPGATRASFGLGATQDDVERLAVALERLVADHGLRDEQLHLVVAVAHRGEHELARIARQHDATGDGHCSVGFGARFE